MEKEVFRYLESLKSEQNDEKLENIKCFKEYFQSFFKKYPYKNYIKMCEVSFQEVFIVSLLIHNPYKSKLILEMTNKYRELFSSEQEDIFFLLMNYIQDKVFKEFINKAITLQDGIPVKVSIPIISVKLGITPKKINEFLSFIIENKDNISKLEEILHDYTIQEYESLTEFYGTAVGIKETLEEMNLPINLVNKTFNKMIKEQEPFFIQFLNYYNFLFQEYNEVLKELDSELKEINRNNRKIEELIHLLGQKGEIKDIATILNLCPTDLAKEKVLDYIAIHNEEYNRNLLSKYLETKLNSDENLTLLFAKYNYDYQVYTEEEKRSIKEIGYDKAEELLQKLKTLSVKRVNVTKIKEDNLNTVLELFQKNILTSPFIERNATILYEDEPLKTILNNIEFLNLFSINISNYNSSIDILLSDLVLKNLNVLAFYRLFINRNTTNILFLQNPDLKEKIELIITMGFFEGLSNLDILNNSLEELLNLKVTKALNISENIKLPISLEDHQIGNYLIPEEALQCLKKKQEKEVSLPESLQEYIINRYVLCINEVYVSIPNLIANLSRFSEITDLNIYYSIIYNSYYSIEEIEALKEFFIRKIRS